MIVKKDFAAENLIASFLTCVKDDPRICSTHISLYTSLIYILQKNEFKTPVYFYRNDLIPFCKISGSATFHRRLKELEGFGYIKYQPSFNHSVGSKVEFLVMSLK